MSDANDGASVVPASAQNVAAQPEGEAQPAPSKFESFFAFTKTLIVRALVIYFITSFFRRPATPPIDKNAPGTPVENKAAWNMFPNGTMYDLFIYISEDEHFTEFSNQNNLFWHEPGLIYGDWSSGPNGDGSYSHYSTIPLSPKVQNNGSIYMHAYAVKTGKVADPNAPPETNAGMMRSYARKQLNKFRKQKYMKTKNLWTGETDRTEEEIEKIERGLKEEIISYWHPNLTLNIITDQTNWVVNTVPPPLDEYIEFIPGNRYRTVLFPNEFWNMIRDYQPINTTVQNVELLVTLQPLSLFKWQLYSAQAARNKWTSGMFGDAFQNDEEDVDQDTLKETLLETSPYLLGATIIVSILHSCFELLAFKNDIQFWNNRESLEGLSVRSVFFNVFQSLIVFLFVLDNDTNMVIRISCLMGLGIEMWKINKVVDFSLDRERRILGIPRICITDKGSYVHSSTKQYDMMAFKYLSWACFPLLAAYAAYSFVYLEHKGWYSFTLNLLYSYLLTFGFIMMTPQLFINYKLKSVAHLPWRMMSYKFLNTFIDDIFAFVIKMPTMYRLGCFRDDIVFIIFLYQRWIYKVDAKRVNEFGFSGEMLEQKTSQPQIAAPPPAETQSDENIVGDNKDTVVEDQQPETITESEEDKKTK